MNFNEARDDGWQWHQLDQMQIVCTSLQTNHHASTSAPQHLHSLLPPERGAEVLSKLRSVTPVNIQYRVREQTYQSAIRIIFDCTSDMPYRSALYYTGLSSLHSRRTDQARGFFQSIMQPDSCCRYRVIRYPGTRPGRLLGTRVPVG